MASLKYQTSSPLLISPHRAGTWHFFLLPAKLSDFSLAGEEAKCPGEKAQQLSASSTLRAGCLGKGHEKMETELDSYCCDGTGPRGTPLHVHSTLLQGNCPATVDSPRLGVSQLLSAGMLWLVYVVYWVVSRM